MRTQSSDEKVKLAPPIIFSLEEALEYIQGDEYVEVTPESIRLRKIHLNENERKSILIVYRMHRITSGIKLITKKYQQYALLTTC